MRAARVRGTGVVACADDEPNSGQSLRCTRRVDANSRFAVGANCGDDFFRVGGFGAVYGRVEATDEDADDSGGAESVDDPRV